ncbi:MAG: peptide chain release factor N(5)-glutamine methyltransferase [bacterium]
MNILTAHQNLTGYLRKRSVESPGLASEIIISHALAIPRIQIYASFERTLADGEKDLIRALARRVADGEPIQLVVGSAHFLGRTFIVQPGVFIPRPETEVLVETVIRLLEDGASGDVSFLDIGAGCGVIAVSLLLRFDTAAATATDVSPAALALAARNAQAHGVLHRLTLLEGDAFAPLTGDPPPLFHCIVSNPPYVKTAEIPALDALVRDHDPRTALDGGDDGLETIRKIVTQSPHFLAPGGLLALEVGAGQAEPTLECFRAAGIAGTRAHRDLAGIERVITGWKK